jgi:4-hydroxybenzoate polyprenyltransferase
MIRRKAESGIVVNARVSGARAAAKITNIDTTLAVNTSWPRALFGAVRPHQWAKNLLVFVPILTAGAMGDIAGWGAASLMFVAFSCAASGGYLVNDLCDLAADRRHPRKRNRPFASGVLPLHIGLIASPLLWLVAFGLSAATGSLPVILLYILASTAYSVYLKSQPLVDVFALAALYTLRLFGGGEATGYRVSLWLLAFSSFMFLSLALVKRVSELRAAAAVDGGRVARRAYGLNDAGILQLLGVASSFVASMVLALYVQSELSPDLGRYPSLSWAIVPLMLFWQCRIWLSTARGHMHDDPLVFAARDWVSWLVAICSFAVMLFGNRVSL